MDEYGFYDRTSADLYDSLTGFYTLTGLLTVAQKESEQIGSLRNTVIYINVSNFKSFNKNYGFVAGNKLLRGLSKGINTLFPDSLCSRSSGDHFLIYTQAKDYSEVKEKFTKLANDGQEYQRGMILHLKAGVFFDDGSEEVGVYDRFDRARVACEYIEKKFDHRIALYTEEMSAYQKLINHTVTGFDEAIDKGYIKPYYQKENMALTGRIAGYEALARWDDPVYGMISPSVFVPSLEDAHLIHKLDLHIIGCVLEDMHTYMITGNDPLPISLNLSRLDFRYCDMFSEVDTLRQAYGIPVDRINIEITESAFAEGSGELMNAIGQFSAAGYEIWMDDFGSGYSSLNNLRQYHFDVIKIDRGFITDISVNPKAKLILSHVINMVKELGLDVVAEGVETKEQYEFLKVQGCGLIQGFYFGRPEPFVSGVRTHEDSSEGMMENMEQREYYRRISGVNVIGLSPLDDRKDKFESDTPTAIMELDDKEAWLLYANKAFMKYLDSISYGTDADPIRLHSRDGISANERFREMAKKAEETGEVVTGEFIVNGNILNNRVRFISRYKDVASFAVEGINLSLQTTEKQSEEVQIALRYMLELCFRVDLFDEDGTVQNIFLNTLQERIADPEMDAKTAVREYSEKYLVPEDRERFNRYYNMDDIMERVAEDPRGFVTDYFRSSLPGDEGRLQRYMILPLMIDGHRKMLSVCRYADGVEKEVVHERRDGKNDPNCS